MAPKKRVTLLTPEQKAIKDALARAKKAKTSENKSTKGKERRAKTKQAKVEAEQVAAASTREEFQQRLESGTAQLPDVGDPRTINFSQAPQAISNNATYHNALAGAITDIRKRLFDIKNDEETKKEEKRKNDADVENQRRLGEWEEKKKSLKEGDPIPKQPALVDWTKSTNASGALENTLVTTATQKKLDGPQYFLDRAEALLQKSYAAHVAGNAGSGSAAFANHVTAMEHFKAASDHVFNAITAANHNFGQEKYGAVLNIGSSKHLADYAQPNNDMSLSLDWNKKLEDVVNGYTAHVTKAGIASGAIHPGVTDELLKDIHGGQSKTTYTQPLFGKEKDLTPNVGVPSWALTKSRAEKKAARKAAAATEVKAATNRAMETAMRKGVSFAKSDEDLTPEEWRTRLQAGYDKFTKPDDGSDDFSDVDAESDRQASMFDRRWKADEIRPMFETDEARNEASAREAGVAYTKKTFTGSSAHSNPDEWHAKYQVKNNWLKQSRANNAHEFDSWWDSEKVNHSGSIDEYAKKNNIAIQPIAKPYKKWAQESGLSAFLPSKQESEEAEEKNQEDVPTAVNQAQLVRASRSGIKLSKDEMMSKLENQVISHPTKKGNDGKPLKVNFNTLTDDEKTKFVNTRVKTTGVALGRAVDFGQTVGKSKDLELPDVSESEPVEPEKLTTTGQREQGYVAESLNLPASRRGAFEEGRGM